MNELSEDQREELAKELRDAYALGRLSVANELLHRGVDLPGWLKTFCQRIVVKGGHQS